MKYFTKEELEDITNELVENPTRETLKILNEKYNGTPKSLTQTNEVPTVTEKNMEEVEYSVEELKPLVNNEVVNETAPIAVPLEVDALSAKPVKDEQTVINIIPNYSVPNLETPAPDGNVNVVSPELPTIELPKIDIPNIGTQNSEMVNFTGNLFEPSPAVPNLMQTTDNFNNASNTMPTTEVPITSTPFFGPHVAIENNPIPVNEGMVNNMTSVEPTMFGQIEQNYM